MNETQTPTNTTGSPQPPTESTQSVPAAPYVNSPPPAPNEQPVAVKSPLRDFALVGMIAALAMPAVGTAVAYLTATQEGKQYAGLVLFLMGAYSIPFLIVAIPGLAIGESYQKKSRLKAANIAFIVSIIASVADIVIIGGWIIAGASGS